MHVETLYSRVVFLIINLCHLFAGVQFWLKCPELETPEIWYGQFYFLLILSLILSLLLFFSQATPFIRTFYFGLKLIVFLVIGYAEGHYLGVEFTLLTALIIEVSAYFDLLWSMLITFGVTGVTVLNQHAIVAWDVPLASVSVHDLLALTLYIGIIAILANACHLAVKKLDDQAIVIDRLDKAISQLMAANVGFQQYAVTAGQESAVQERKRISRDIHDTAVHTFITVIMLAESVVDLVEAAPQKTLEILQQLIALAKEGVQDTRQALRELRAIDEASPKGLQAISRLIRVFRNATGVEVDVDFGNVPWEFHNELDRFLYRMIQEGLTNAFRHGKATYIHIRLWIFESQAGDELIIRIHDNGQGSSEIKQGIGLQGMEERVKKLQGRLEAKNMPGGFDVIAWIPLRTHEPGNP
jgi:signal transduction histidine kinase